ncbi:MAG: carbon starvation protein A [Kiritimatiellae bacterium]|nr:carbon starvation protein A [Kiritimatiellia bacterium]
MNGMLLLVGGALLFIIAYLTYGKYLERLFGIKPDRATPAHTQTDGVDYIPTRLPVLFGHHFASIAGAGPIVGPVAAAYLGWGAVAIWIVVGCIIIGAVHDFAALFLSIRNNGHSIGHVIEAQLGYAGRIIFLLFCWVALVLVVAIFALLVAKTFVATPAVATSSLLFIILAPIFGTLVYRRNVSLVVASLIFVPLLFAGIWIGAQLPLDLTSLLSVSDKTAANIWLMVLFAYVFVASTIPVWMLLQPRDYLNSYLLYAMIIAGFGGILIARPEFQMPAFVGWSAEKPGGGMGSLFPILYVTVACGACSGFHALVSSGTTAKQLFSERHIRPIGYGSMLIEGLVALMALIAVASLAPDDFLAKLSAGQKIPAFAEGLASFTAYLGISPALASIFFSLTISAFMLTTLDTATRLTRFTWQELFIPPKGHESDPVGSVRRYFAHPITATAIAVTMAGYLAFSGDAGRLWPVFGASNQLLAALTLLIVTLWLVRRRKNFWVTLAPMIFMTTITVWALVQLFTKNLVDKKMELVIATAFLLIMAVVLAAQSVWFLRKTVKTQ